MAPYLQTVKSFVDVPITDAGVDTVEFLKAAEGLVGIFDLLGGIAFAAVKKDLTTNIGKVRTRYNAAPEKSATLEQLVANEKAEKLNTASEGLTWLLRGLAFTCKALQTAQANKSEELASAFRKGYEETLKKYHNFLMKGAFSAALSGCPYRADFYHKLAEDPNGVSALSQDQLSEELDKWLAALDVIVTRLQLYYK
ncbi:glycolipid transfer protein [Cristinia sonorae]|uniref:Glycolipid transfer protein n=1 Tax=Cristinia sonorae TaxID=1940300 RepID=A0A8K0UXR3_9AGAR|nr:glycolipid transfer protein [Cristinia sonorae]